MTNLKTNILTTLKENKIHMIPRWKFILYSLTGIFGMLFLITLTVFVGSLVIFTLSRYGFLDMSFFEFITTMRNIATLPLVLILCTVVLLGLVEYGARRYAFAKKQPIMITLLVVSILVLGTSFLIGESRIHERVHRFAEEKRIPFMTRAYDRPFERPKSRDGLDIVRGVVVGTTSTSTLLRVFNGELLPVTATGTKIVPELGEDVVLFGNFSNGTFMYEKIRKAHRPPFMNGMQNGERPREINF